MLVPLRDGEAFAAAAESMMRRRDEWPELRRAARATAEAITWEKVFASFEDTLERVRTGRFGAV